MQNIFPELQLDLRQRRKLFRPEPDLPARMFPAEPDPSLKSFPVIFSQPLFYKKQILDQKTGQ